MHWYCGIELTPWMWFLYSSKGFYSQRSMMLFFNFYFFSSCYGSLVLRRGSGVIGV